MQRAEGTGELRGSIKARMLPLLRIDDYQNACLFHALLCNIGARLATYADVRTRLSALTYRFCSI
jgi:hypothetical protein